MIFIPRPYQVQMKSHPLHLDRSALWAGMGLGKTPTCLEIVSMLDLLGEIRHVLALAPRRVALNTWPEEVRKWENFHHLSIRAAVGTVQQRIDAIRARPLITTINYDNLPWLVDKWGSDWPYDMVIADESTRLKSLRTDTRIHPVSKKKYLRSSGGKRAGKLAKVAHTKVRHWINLTGTPSPNGLIDLWGQSWYLDAGRRLGRTYTAFEERWFRTARSGYGLEPMPFAEEQIHDRLKDICFSFDSKDHFDLPDLVNNTIYVDLPPRAMQIYKKMEKEMFTELATGTEVEAFNAASKTIKCLQLANGALYTDDKGTWENVHDAKLDALESIIEEASGMPVMVAYQFKSDLARLQRRFPQGQKISDTNIAAWNRGEISPYFVHPASAGHGLNLQDGGNILAFFGHWWNLEEYLQIIERIGPTRQAQSGYDRPTFVHHIVARNTLDQLVMVRRENKKRVQDVLMEATRHGYH